jgi:hypothetical protein
VPEIGEIEITGRDLEVDIIDNGGGRKREENPLGRKGSAYLFIRPLPILPVTHDSDLHHICICWERLE